MNILLLANKVPYPPRDGGSKATFHLIKGFSAEGHGIWVLAINTPKHPSSPDDFPDDVKDLARWRVIPVDVTVSPVAAIRNLLFSKLPYNLVRFYSAGFATALKELLTTNSFQVVQLEGLAMAQYLTVIRQHSDAAVVMRAHNVEFTIWERHVHQLKPGFRRFYLSLLADRIRDFETGNLNSYDALVPISPADLEVFRSQGFIGPYHVAPFGLEPGFPGDEAELPPSPVLFFIGALDWIPNREGLTWFIRNVWRRLKDRRPGLVFTVAGRNAPSRFARKMAREGIRFLGEIPDAKGYIQQGSIMVVPLFSGSGMRVKIIEGMGLGRTVITTTVGAEGIPGVNGKHFLIADDAESFADSLEQCITRPDLCAGIGREARDFVTENFDNLVISQNLLGFYTSLLP